MVFKDWLISIGKSERTSNSYSTAIKGAISDWAIDNAISDRRLNEIRSYNEIKDIANRLEDVDIYQQRNSDGNSMYSAALKKYAEYLFEYSSEDIQEDINSVLENDEISITEKSTLISTRIGQGKFKNGLIDYWQGCAITGYADISLLVASHIKPWKVANNQERLDPYNGLLLLPNLDKAFDLGYITFQEHGEIVMSPSLESPDVLGINGNMTLNIGAEHQGYMEFHRNSVYQD